MPKIKYRDIPFKGERLTAVEHVNRVINEYLAQGFRLTVRQIYYQFVARDLFPDDRTWVQDGQKWKRSLSGSKNAEPNYKWLGDVINDGRLAGLIDWNAVEDRTRYLRTIPSWANPASIVDACASQFRVDMWQHQEYRPEVWIEKDALVGVIEGVCEELGVAYFSCRGYTSQSGMWEAAQRLLGYRRRGQKPVIFHFGDHDPSGIDMSRDITDRIEEFSGGVLDFDRLALNMNQIEELNPPPNPAKITDPRAGKYIELHGDESWELDALQPTMIAELIRTAITGIRDEDQWMRDEERQAVGREQLTDVSNRWEEIISG